jgi:uncharacterized membrane protein YbhN (UPF0104 family)
VLRGLLLTAIALAVFALLRMRDSDLTAFLTAFANVSWRWAAAAIAMNLLSAIAGTLAWRTVIVQAMPPPRARYRDVLSAFSIGLLGNIVVPGRAGELARIAVLAPRLQKRQASFATLGGTVVAYRLLDLVPSLLLIGYVLIAAPIAHWAVVSLALVAAVGVCLLAAGFASARRHERLIQASGRFRELIRMGREGLGILRAPIPAALATAYQLSAWCAQLLAVFATMRAFGLDLSLGVAAVVLALVNLAILFPLWPGNVGLLQATVALPLVTYGVSYGHGIAFGVGLQAIEISVGVSLGLIFLAREGLTLPVRRRSDGAGKGPAVARALETERG